MDARKETKIIDSFRGIDDEGNDHSIIIEREFLITDHFDARSSGDSIFN